MTLTAWNQHSQKRLSHVNIKTASKLPKHDLVRAVPKFTK